jgi:MFS family permease
MHRLGYFLAALVPFLLVERKGTVLVWLLVLFNMPAQFFMVGWNAVLADVVPEVHRARVFAARYAVAALAVTGGVFIAGLWLERVGFPANYQALYVVGFGSALVALTFMARLQIPDVAAPATTPFAGNPRAVWRQARHAIRTQPDFVRIVINTLLYGLGQWMIAPLFVLYFVRVLGATDGWIGINTTLANLAPVVGYYVWQRAIVRRGEKWVLILAVSVAGLYGVLVGLTPNLALILVWTAQNGFVAAGINLSQFSMLLKVCPDGDRPAYLGVYTTILNSFAFVMPLLGVYLADRIGIPVILVAGGLLCLVGSQSFRIWPLQTSDSQALREAPVKRAA